MKTASIEIFLEDDCPSCKEVEQLISEVVRGGKIPVRYYHRTLNPDEFERRRVAICPATFINHRLTFYGCFTLNELKQHLQF